MFIRAIFIFLLLWSFQSAFADISFVRQPSISYDGGRTSDAYSNLPLGSIYSIGVDMEDPYNL